MLRIKATQAGNKLMMSDDDYVNVPDSDDAEDYENVGKINKGSNGDDTYYNEELPPPQHPPPPPPTDKSRQQNRLSSSSTRSSGIYSGGSLSSYGSGSYDTSGNVSDRSGQQTKSNWRSKSPGRWPYNTSVSEDDENIEEIDYEDLSDTTPTGVGQASAVNRPLPAIPSDNSSSPPTHFQRKHSAARGVNSTKADDPLNTVKIQNIKNNLRPTILSNKQNNPPVDEVFDDDARSTSTIVSDTGSTSSAFAKFGVRSTSVSRATPAGNGPFTQTTFHHSQKPNSKTPSAIHTPTQQMSSPLTSPTSPSGAHGSPSFPGNFKTKQPPPPTLSKPSSVPSNLRFHDPMNGNKDVSVNKTLPSSSVATPFPLGSSAALPAFKIKTTSPPPPSPPSTSTPSFPKPPTFGGASIKTPTPSSNPPPKFPSSKNPSPGNSGSDSVSSSLPLWQQQQLQRQAARDLSVNTQENAQTPPKPPNARRPPASSAEKTFHPNQKSFPSRATAEGRSSHVVIPPSPKIMPDLSASRHESTPAVAEVKTHQIRIPWQKTSVTGSQGDNMRGKSSQASHIPARRTEDAKPVNLISLADHRMANGNTESIYEEVPNDIVQKNCFDPALNKKAKGGASASAVPPPPPPREMPPRETDESYEQDLSDIPDQDSLCKFSWYFGTLSREDSETKLNKHLGKDGAFLVRKRTNVTDSCPYCISVVCQGRIYQLLIRHRSDKLYAIGKEKHGEKVFDDVPELIRFYQKNAIELADVGKKVVLCRDLRLKLH